jgi:hypothetical protein
MKPNIGLSLDLVECRGRFGATTATANEVVVISLDWWSPVAGLAAAAIVKLGVLPHVPW